MAGGAFKITGDFAKLNGIEQRFAQSNVDRALELANRNMADEALGLVAEGFASGTDPYGKPWSAPHNLQITGGIRRYVASNVDKNGFRIHSTNEKAIWHHAPRPRDAWGGKALPTRLQVPLPGKLPGVWAQRLREAAEDAAKLFR